MTTGATAVLLALLAVGCGEDCDAPGPDAEADSAVADAASAPVDAAPEYICTVGDVTGVCCAYGPGGACVDGLCFVGWGYVESNICRQ